MYRLTLRSDDRDASQGSTYDATYTLNWSAPIDQDRQFMIILDSLHIQEPTSGNSGYTDKVLVAELGQICTNVYDTHHGRTSGTLAAWKGLSYSSAPHMAGVTLYSPVWQQGSITLRINTLDGAPATGLQNCAVVATLLIYPVN